MKLTEALGKNQIYRTFGKFKFLHFLSGRKEEKEKKRQKCFQQIRKDDWRTWHKYKRSTMYKLLK